METIQGVALRGICHNYFEQHVSPILKYVQQTQEQLNLQTRELRDGIAKKAEASEVPSLKQFEDLAAKVCTIWMPDANCGVSILVRLQELHGMLKQKADASTVPTLAQLNRLDARLVACTRELTSCCQEREALEQKVKELGETVTLNAPDRSEVKPAVRDAPNLHQLDSLRADMEKRLSSISEKLSRCATVDEGGQRPPSPNNVEPGMQKLQVLLAAAGSRFDKQLKEVRQQMRELREQFGAQAVGHAEASNLSSLSAEDGVFKTPRGQRSQSSLSALMEEDAESVADSDVGSLAGSVAGSLAAEDRAELKRIQAVVAAAGTAFNKELRELRRQTKELRAEMLALKKGQLEFRGAGDTGAVDLEPAVVSG